MISMEFPALRKFSLFSLLTLCVGCTPILSSDSAVIDSLKNRGAVTLDPQNPYLAANRFLKDEMATSTELAGFLNLKGYPASLELKESAFNPLELIFYYPSIGERYDLTKSQQGWIINGPYRDGSKIEPIVSPTPRAPLPTSTPIAKKEAKKALPTPNVDTPLPTPTASGFSSPEPTEVPTVFATPSPVPTEELAPVKVKSALETSRPEPALSAAAESEQPLAEISPRGDLVHYVTLPGETLSIIARWYTEDRANAGKIGRLNRLKSSDSLSIGDTIVIPSYMIKNKVRLSEESLTKLQAVAQAEKQRAK